jgi:hypothetical protein
MHSCASTLARTGEKQRARVAPTSRVNSRKNERITTVLANRNAVSAVLLITLCAAPRAAVPADAAGEAAIRQQCLAAAERIWPSATGDIAQYNRFRYFLELGCLNNGGRTPD